MLLSAVCIHAKAQTISAGYGFFDTNQEVFKKGQKFEFEAGNRLSKIVLCNLYYSHGIVPEIKNFYPMFIIYSFDSPTIDTFYNVHEVNKYKMETFLFKARFYTNPSNKLSIFITPLVGFTKLSETKIHTGDNYKSNIEYPYSSITLGLETGIEYPLTKRKNLLINASQSIYEIWSQQYITDIYLPPFTSKNTHYLSFQIKLRYEFSKEYLLPKD